MRMFLLSLLLMMVSVVTADAQPVRDLGKIVVTPYRYEGALDRVTGDVRLIGREEIKGSNAKTAIDVIRPLTGVNVRDWYGNGTKVSVDMAGFGEQAGLNTLVLVDGRRVNDVDLSGTDWSLVPVDRIERIEVVRSGSGAVLYGDNAAGGVINIITGKGTGAARVQAHAAYGSYQYNDQGVTADGREGKWSYHVSGERKSTQGYRENAYSRANDLASGLSYAATDILTLRFDAGLHQADYGMPGALWQTQIDKDNRRFARYGRDHVLNRDYHYVWGALLDLEQKGSVDIDAGFRQKHTDSFFLTSGLYTQRSQISTYTLTPKYTLTHTFLDRDNRLVAGVDGYKADYRSGNYDMSNEDDLKNRTRIQKLSAAGYLNDEYELLDKVTLSGGYRLEQASYLFDYHDYSAWNPDIARKVHHDQWAAHAGLAYAYDGESAVYMDISRSFRFPQVDEFTYNDAMWQQQLNTALRPQTATMCQVGVRHAIGEKTKTDVSLYRMRLTDELYYNSTGGPSGAGQNQNYDKTIHEGVAVSVESGLTRRLSVTGGYTYTHAYFTQGEYDGKLVPVVPGHKLGAGMKLLLPLDMVWNLTGTYIGKKYALNDQANAHGWMNGYFTADTNLGWQEEDWSLSVGVNNLFNKRYAEYGGWATNPATSAPDRFYYPSPRRNYTVSMTRRF